MLKVVFNNCVGGFCLSDKAMKELNERGYEGNEYDIQRHDPRLVEVVEELGSDANGFCSDLAIACIDGSKYRIHEYDGNETVQEPDDIDWITVPKYCR